ncbi:MAG: tetratricopeptide repeat protein [Chloroflexota bacterium]
MSTADTLKEQGIQQFTQHDYEAANRTFQQAKDAYEEAGNYDMVAEMKVNIGLVHRSLGENQQALDLMQEALTHFKNTDDKMRMAQVFGNLGGVYQALNDKEQTELSYRQAANLFNEMGEEKLYSDTLMALGAFQMRDGQLVAGAATYQVALENRENLTGTQKIIRSLTNFISRVSGGS